MELTIHIKKQKDVASFLNLIRKMDYIEIIDIKKSDSDLPIEHRKLLDERLKRVEIGETKFKDWDSIKTKYEERAH